MMRAADVLEVLELLARAGVGAWVDGGWGVDALLGEQTRAHNDLDLAINHFDVERYTAAMAATGYRPKPTDLGTPRNFVMVDDAGREVDVHLVDLAVVVPGEHGRDVYGPNGLAYEVGALEGWGTIAGVRVPCGTAEFQVRSHSVYEPDVDDYRDVRALCDRFGIALPEIYERFE
jgi:lincosamide nucleotidyltransferase A/C/D/E